MDGLQSPGYPVRLANPAGMEAYNGIKRTDVDSDALWIAEMLRLDILPEGYIYPKAERPIRDMRRRRLLIVRPYDGRIMPVIESRAGHSSSALAGISVITGSLSCFNTSASDAPPLRKPMCIQPPFFHARSRQLQFILARMDLFWGENVRMVNATASWVVDQFESLRRLEFS